MPQNRQDLAELLASQDPNAPVDTSVAYPQALVGGKDRSALARFLAGVHMPSASSVVNGVANGATGAAHDLYAPVQFSQDFLNGKIDPHSDEAIGGALGMAGTAMTGGFGGVPASAGEAVLGAGPTRGKPPTNMSQVPNIRGLPVDEAVKIASKDPHLIPAGDQSEGYFVGGPRDIQSKRGLTNLRKEFDQYVAADPRGGDWYDRYRAGTNEVTGGDPANNLYQSRAHGMMSAGVDPFSEGHFVTKELNAFLSGSPVKAARPAQHEAFMKAVGGQPDPMMGHNGGPSMQAGDPDAFQLGKKTGAYAQLINPDLQQVQGATGVNDFRHARNFRYTDAAGEAQRDALTDAQHRFLDYETANAVGRANKAGLAGRSDWTGEQLQAAPWVRQKALAIQEKAGIDPATGQPKMSYEDAFAKANTTAADYHAANTAFATHEAVPGADTGHLPGFVGADEATRNAYTQDPRSTWATAPGGRDGIYGGLTAGNTPMSMKVRPTVENQGMYTPPGGQTEFNQGWTARPVVSFQSGGPAKVVDAGSRALLDAGEATRGYIDAQNASAWHKPYVGGQASMNDGLHIPLNRSLSPEEMQNLQTIGAPHGIGNVVDTGQGATLAAFGGDVNSKALGKGMRGELAAKIGAALPDASGGHLAHIDSGYVDYVPHWQAGEGSGAATDHLLSQFAGNPGMRDTFNRNPYIPEAAGQRMARDADWSQSMGPVRQDIQNARDIVSQGPGWIDRLEAARKAGVSLPAMAGGALGGGALMQDYLQQPPAPEGY